LQRNHAMSLRQPPVGEVFGHYGRVVPVLPTVISL
jgi:hypothetical protein